MSSELQWWGYKHVDGSVKIKRFFDNRDIDDALESDFVHLVAGPVTAVDSTEAQDLLMPDLVPF